MLRMISALESLAIRATDGEIGSTKNVFFDDEAWVIRYLVVDTSRWLLGRKVLISPYAVRGVDWQAGHIEVTITREQVKGSPDVDTEKPVSRQHEAEYLGYYGYPYYWGGTLAWGAMPIPTVPVAAQDQLRRDFQKEQERADPHLRSFDAVAKYGIEATDGSLGHVDDFLYDEETWEVRYLVVDTRSWLPGRRVLVSTEWIDNVNWDERLVSVSLTREAIKESPEWDPDEQLTADDESSLYRHYGRSPRSLQRPNVQIR